MKQLLTILFILSLLFLGCKEKSYFPEKATIYDGQTHIAIPEYYRQKVGYDSIQLTITHEGKIEANFCYPNKYIKY